MLILLLNLKPMMLLVTLLEVESGMNSKTVNSLTQELLETGISHLGCKLQETVEHLPLKLRQLLLNTSSTFLESLGRASEPT